MWKAAHNAESRVIIPCACEVSGPNIYIFKSSGNYGFFFLNFWSFSRGVSVCRSSGSALSLRGAWSFPKRPLPKGEKEEVRV